MPSPAAPPAGPPLQFQGRQPFPVEPTNDAFGLTPTQQVCNRQRWAPLSAQLGASHATVDARSALLSPARQAGGGACPPPLTAAPACHPLQTTYVEQFRRRLVQLKAFDPDQHGTCAMTPACCCCTRAAAAAACPPRAAAGGAAAERRQGGWLCAPTQKGCLCRSRTLLPESSALGEHTCCSAAKAP